MKTKEITTAAKHSTPVILHAHMFKNAGSTLDWSLARSFGSRFLDHRDDAVLRDRPEGLDALLADSSELLALSSHWLPLPLTAGTRERAVLLFMLRHPLDRARSVYDFERRQTSSEGPSPQQARTLGFREFVEWRLEAGRGPVLKNFQVRYLSGRFHDSQLETSFDAALSLLDSTPLFGLVERYDQSMVLFEQHLGPRFRDLDLSYLVQNSTRERSESLTRRLDALRQELGDSFDHLVAENSYDLALYEHGVHLFQRRYAALDDADGQLAAFQARCEALAA